jgi:hypothetical protein
VEIRLPLLVDKSNSSAGTVKDNLIAAISAESARLKSAVAVVDMEEATKRKRAYLGRDN